MWIRVGYCCTLASSCAVGCAVLPRAQLCAVAVAVAAAPAVLLLSCCLLYGGTVYSGFCKSKKKKGTTLYTFIADTTFIHLILVAAAHTYCYTLFQACCIMSTAGESVTWPIQADPLTNFNDDMMMMISMILMEKGVKKKKYKRLKEGPLHRLLLSRWCQVVLYLPFRPIGWTLMEHQSPKFVSTGVVILRLSNGRWSSIGMIIQQRLGIYACGNPH